jgi:hypothetical protein
VINGNKLDWFSHKKQFPSLEESLFMINAQGEHNACAYATKGCLQQPSRLLHWELIKTFGSF